MVVAKGWRREKMEREIIIDTKCLFMHYDIVPLASNSVLCIFNFLSKRIQIKLRIPTIYHNNNKKGDGGEFGI